MAQEGDYFYTNFETPSDQIDNANFQITQDLNGIMCVANRAGVLRFDGVNWEIISTPGAVFSLAVDSLNRLYVGGRFGFGYLQRNDNFDLTYQSLSDSVRSGQDIFDVKLLGGKTYFLNQKNVFVYNGENISAIGLENASTFITMAVFNNNIILSTDAGNTYQLQDSTLATARGLPNEDSPVLFINASPGGTKHVMGTAESALFIHQNNTWLPLQIDDEGYISESELVGASWINENLIAVATLDGGVVFIDVDKRKVNQIINYRSGLPDNEVFAMGVDRDKGLWVAHEFGFTRVTPELAFRRFGTFPGLDGSLTSVTTYDGKLYVATSVGVFYLAEVKDYDEVTYFVKQKTTNTNQPKKAKTSNTKSDRPKKRGVLGFLKKNRNNPQQSTTSSNSSKKGFLSNVFNKSEDGSAWQRRTRRELRSIRYQYTAVDGIESKTTQLIKANGSLLVVGLDGITEVTSSQSQRVTDEPIRYAFHSAKSNLLIVSTFFDDVQVFQYQNNQWQLQGAILGIEDLVQHITEDSDGNFWLVGSDVVFKAGRSGGRLTLENEYDFDNPFFEDAYTFEYNGETKFINSAGYFEIDESKALLTPDEDLIDALGLPKKYLRGDNGVVWTFDGTSWTEIGKETRQGAELLNVFSDLNYIAEDSNGLWIIDGSNGLVRLSLQEYERLNSQLPVYLKEVRVGSRKIKPSNALEISQQESSVSFNFIQPDYAGVFKFEYQYRLEGLREQWSDWSAANRVIDFPYLPDGKYVLHVQTKDVFGQIVSVAPMEFTVVPPYWKQPWFYALEVVLFGALFILSFRLNRIDHKYRILSRLLAFMTLIITVEFVQTIAENRFETESSPVVEFFIQVSIAFLILPIEMILRKAFFKGSGDSLVDKSTKAETGEVSKA